MYRFCTLAIGTIASASRSRSTVTSDSPTCRIPLVAKLLEHAELVGRYLRAHLDEELAPIARRLRAEGEPDLAVGTSKTFRSLARLTGAAPSAAGLRVRRTLSASGLRQLIAFVTRMSSADLAELEGVSPSRAHQLAAGALVAEATMRALDVPVLEICPWALREGVILRRLDLLDGTAQTDRSAHEGPHALGRLTTTEARCSG